MSQAAWLEKLSAIPHDIYHENESAHHRHSHVGLESMAYLRFIAEHYDCLPKVIS